jgi:hypothetical protein
MEFKEARAHLMKVDRSSREAVESLLKKIGPYGEIDTISILLRDLSQLGMKKALIGRLLTEEMHWPKNVARKLIKESGVK